MSILFCKKYRRISCFFVLTARPFCGKISVTLRNREESPLLICYSVILCVMSAVAFVFFAVDKANAADDRARIPEVVLLTLAALGGGTGALLGRFLLHHKSNVRRKLHFAVTLFAATAMQLTCLLYLAVLKIL